MKARDRRWWFAIFVVTALLPSVRSEAAQKELQKLTVGYTPISGAAIPLFIALEEKIFQKYGYDVAGIFMGGSPLINSAILAGEFPLGYTGGGAIISSRLGGSDLIAIASPLQVLTIDGWARPEIKSIADLRGKRVGVTRFGASTYFAALSMLESAGVKPGEVTFIQNGGVGESFAALTGGRVDVCMIGYPFGLRAKNAGFQLLFRPSTTEYGLFPDGRHRGARLLVEGRQEPQGGGGFFARAWRRSSIGQRKRRRDQESAQEIHQSQRRCRPARQLRVLQGRFPPDAESRGEGDGERAKVCRTSQSERRRCETVLRQQFG